MTSTLSAQQTVGATGVYWFTVTNPSGPSCGLNGYFQVSIYGTAGQPLATADTRLPPGPGDRPPRLNLAAGGSAVVEVGIGAGPTCTDIGFFKLVPPGETTAITVPVTAPPPASTTSGSPASTSTTPATAPVTPDQDCGGPILVNRTVANA